MTHKDNHDISRRRVLASAGALGVGVLGSGGLRSRVTTPSAQRYTHYTYAAPSDLDLARLKVAWYSTYNGARTELSSTETALSGADDSTNNTTASGSSDDTESGANLEVYVDDVDGPLFAESNVLPGDFGTASIGLFVEGEQPVRVQLRPTVEGALAEVIDVTLGYDTGFFGIGGCGGADTPEDVAEDVTMSLAAFGETYGDDTGSGLLLTPSCLQPGDGLCLGFAWEVDEDVANQWQGASVAFELAFVAEGCEL
jgi:hypothetical protein